MIYDINKLHHGEQSLSREILKIIPLIEKHFKPWDGERVAIKSGRSAKFQKTVMAFYKDCAAVSDMRVIVDDNYSIWIKCDIHEKDKPLTGGGHTVNYFKRSFHIGTIDTGSFQHNATGIFTYEYKPDNPGETRDYCEKILNTSVEDLEKAKAYHKEALKAAEAARKSVPYCFAELFDNR